MKPKKRRPLRRVAVITGSRAEYGLLRSTMHAVDQHPHLKLQVVVTGMHLLPKFGRTINDIRRDGWMIDARVRMQDGSDDAIDQALGLSRGVADIARYLLEAKTDMVVVLGDRIEAMAGALAAATVGCVLAHIHGGDIAPGDLDDSLRHAITKLAHIHFAATRKSAQRIERMGEAKRRIHLVGAPGLDRLAELVKECPLSTSNSKHALVIQHPCGRSAAYERKVMLTALRAVAATGLERTILYPNSDRGHQGIIEAIEKHHEQSTDGSVRVVRSLDHDGYLKLLISADVLIGNSSSGIIEAATAGTPVVNIGPRQTGRERSGPSVVDAKETATSIREALRRALQKRPIMGRETVYGRGGVGRRIAAILSKTRLDRHLRTKINAY